jgi:hypothetical protein
MAQLTGIGNGASAAQGVQAKQAEASGEPTAAHSTHSPSIKYHPVKENLTGQDVLSILENALVRIKGFCQSPVRVIQGNDSTVILVLPAPIRYCQSCHHLRLFEEMMPDGLTCTHCSPASAHRP